MAAQNGNGAKPKIPSGVPVDGKFWNLTDFSTRQRQEIRDIVRDSTGDPTIADVWDDRVSETDDLVPAIVYIVRRYYTDGGDENYKLDQVYDLRSEDYDRMFDEAVAALPPAEGGKSPKGRSKPPSESSVA